MNPTQPQTPPTDPPIVVSDDEVEQLLQQAESLVGRIADDSGVEAASPEEMMNAAVELPLADPAIEPQSDNALQAVEATDEISNELSEILDQASEAVSVETVAVPQEPIDNSMVEEPDEAVDAMMESIESAALNEVLDEFDTGQPAEPVRDEKIEKTSNEDQAMEPAEPVQTESSTPPPETVQPQSAEPPPKLPLKKRLAAFGRAILRAMMAVPIAIVNLILRLIVLVDRPFAALASETKLRIGLLGLVTIFMGISAWVLPRITDHNPYLTMDR